MHAVNQLFFPQKQQLMGKEILHDLDFMATGILLGVGVYEHREQDIKSGMEDMMTC